MRFINMCLSDELRVIHVVTQADDSRESKMFSGVSVNGITY